MVKGARTEIAMRASQCSFEQVGPVEPGKNYMTTRVLVTTRVLLVCMFVVCVVIRGSGGMFLSCMATRLQPVAVKIVLGAVDGQYQTSHLYGNSEIVYV